jgi:proteasome assembly chaperone (PAC2) family protein
MAEIEPLRESWLVAAWPGMGNVAVGAASYLVLKLNATLTHELHEPDLFDAPQVDVRGGIAKVVRLPRNMFFEWRNPAAERDLLIFIGEAQPVVGGYALCHRLLDYAASRGVKRLFTFAAMASQLHPAGEPRVFGVANDSNLLPQLTSLEVEVLKQGQISGLNGVLLSTGRERQIPGICLMGELPYFAAAVPNPKASQAVLEIFTTMAGIDLDMADIKEQGTAVQKALVQLLEKMQDTARQGAEPGEESFTVPDFAKQRDEPEPDPPVTTDGESKDSAPPNDKKKQRPIDRATRRRIDAMFESANEDRDRAFQLKEELDRLGVFEQYENRFLDLFRKAE